MGAYSTGIFDDDVAADVREQFLDLLRQGTAPTAATRSLIEARQDAIDDADDGPVVWLALAATQWEYGCLQARVRDRALKVLATGVDLSRWSGPSAQRRRDVLDKLKDKLLSPQPKFRRPRRMAPKPLPAKKSISPDGQAGQFIGVGPER